MTNNKILISMLIILLLIIGGLGYYSYDLNRQFDLLDQKLTVLETEQANRINNLSNEISGFREESLSSYRNLEGKLEKTGSEMGALSEQITAADTRIAGVEGKTGALISDITGLTGRIENTEKRLSGSIIDAKEIFNKISRVTVRITNGQSVIGSGFIYATQGYIVTAYHVVQALSQIYVIMDDGTVSKAGVTGFSQPSDVAVLKLANTSFPDSPVIGNSAEIRIGESVVTVGSPGDSSQALGLKDTLTAGVISQLNRYVNVDGNWVANMIQFDAAVNFGNSGGPLANSGGEIIGLITARIDPTLGDGIYYAVSSNKFKRVADAIIASGSFAYPWVGVSIRNISPEEVVDKALETIHGAFVSEVITGSPAQAAGIRAGDIILSVEDISIKDVDELVSYLGENQAPGQEVILSIIRGTQKLEISVEIGIRP